MSYFDEYGWSDEELFQYESDAGYTAPGNDLFSDNSSWLDWASPLDFSATGGTSATSSDTGSFDFSMDGFFKGATSLVKGISDAGDAAMKTAAVLGKTSGQFKSLKDVFNTSESSVMGVTNWSQLLVKAVPYIVLIGGAVVIYKMVRK
jgi:hypothetical protein